MNIHNPYEEKPAQYFGGVRDDFLSLLPDDKGARILEIGCGYGETGASALASGKCAEYVGVEISEKAAGIARDRISSVVIGNVETIALPWDEDTFDALIMSEVLEHLYDPWAVLARLNPLLRNGALVMASSPNVSHYSVIASLLAGRWELTDTGVMDRTHLRWFTPGSYRRMFEDAGFIVDRLEPVTPPSWKVKCINLVTFDRLSHLFFRQVKLIGRKMDHGRSKAS